MDVDEPSSKLDHVHIPLHQSQRQSTHPPSPLPLPPTITIHSTQRFANSTLLWTYNVRYHHLCHFPICRCQRYCHRRRRFSNLYRQRRRESLQRVPSLKLKLSLVRREMSKVESKTSHPLVGEEHTLLPDILPVSRRQHKLVGLCLS
ncbi:hypothetical protein BD410DRAFT_444517 [Rickenella mellea]|uniref:Uncharacterized protein n=1 Tax=Rickenella mellea TaxID=50990 RepID=A0A4Y7PV64_9AGAM|nr:hypothetical protein BD410DRAFT_444517 [Rickenella mellea]